MRSDRPPTGGPPAASWTLRSASSCYHVGLAPDGLGPVLLGWDDTDAAQPAEPPVASHWNLLADLHPLEYGVLGTRQRRSAELIVDHGNGLVGARVSWQDGGELVKDGPETTVVLRGRDSTEHLDIALRITASQDHDVIRKKAVITNLGDQPLWLPRAFGPAWDLPAGEPPTIDFLAGDWGAEFGPHRLTLPAGSFSIGSRQGVTSHTYQPLLAASTEDASYGCALSWSGSWRMVADRVPLSGRLRISAGVDDESCVIRLDPGESFSTPDVLGVRAPEGIGGLPRRWHQYQRQELSRDSGTTHRPIVYNSWFATKFAIDVDHQVALAERAAEIGAEVFVLDDGWFRGRISDTAGLGDWEPDPEKFPDGLDPLITRVTGLGMRFGLWVEPEAVNPNSDLHREHPDWVYRAGNRPLVSLRNQYVLDFGRPEVVDWVENMLRQLLADRRISYLKWDMNRLVTDGGRPGDDHGRQWSVQHVEGYHRVLRMLRTEFGHVTVEACSAGGGRIDTAVLGLVDLVWPSDETGPRARLAVQHGFLSAYGPHVMSSWVTDVADRVDRDPVTREFRFVVAMAGVLGLGSDLLGWSAAERARAAELLELYREIRPVIHTGRVERHGTPADAVYAIEYGTPGRTVMLAFGRPNRPERPVVRPRTLHGDRDHRIVGTGRTIRAGGDLEIEFNLADDVSVLILDEEGDGP